MERADILVVDDDPRMVEGMEEMLREEGYSVAAFENSADAIGYIKKKKPTIAFVDMVMPGKSGIDLLKEIKSIRPQTKVIIITGFATIESAVEAIKVGATDYITKPFKMNEIQNLVKKTFEEISFQRGMISTLKTTQPDEIIKAISNSIRRDTILLLESAGKMRFTDIRGTLGIRDPTKLSFHLRELKNSSLLVQDENKAYRLSSSGKKTARLLREL